jgi:hypothetical protein
MIVFVSTTVAVRVGDGPVVEQAHLLFVREGVYARRMMTHAWVRTRPDQASWKKDE